MTSHKCGNCFFFQEAGFAGSGWCLNADRAQSSDVRSLVRRNELACRNDWGANLWADPKTAAETGAVLKRIDLEAERPATASEISSVVGIREPASRGIPEDRITVPAGEDRVASAAARPARPGDEWFGTGPSNGTLPSAPVTTTRSQQSGDSMDGEDLVVGDIRVRDMGDTGRRPLVDQIPADIHPRRGPVEPVMPSVADAPLPEPRPIRAIRPVPTLSTTRNDAFDGTADLDVHAPVIEGLRTRNLQDRSTSEGPALAPDGSSPRSADALRRSSPTGRAATTDPASGDAGTSLEERPTRAAPRANLIAPHLPAGVTPAPVPEPVPAREMTRRDTRSTSGNARPVIPRSTSPQPERPAASSARPVMATALPDHPDHLAERPTYRRPATLPELPQERLDARMADSTPMNHGDAVGPVMAPRQDRSAGTRRNQVPSPPESRAQRPAPMDELEQATPRRSAGRPPVPGGQRRPTPPPARTIPTVGEVRASRDGSRPSGHEQRAPEHPAPERQARTPIPDRRRNGRPSSVEPSRDDRTRWDDEPTGTFGNGPSVDQLLPPVQLRPELANYGDYGDWMKLDPVMPRLAPDLARRCETCRDFRPAADGERGWCANKDAFTVRKVVYADELPCMNSFGCWWVPYDDIWLSEASVREHRNPTPLLDQLMPELGDWTREDRRRGS